ncbi:pentatricopeptide repeat-containing protein 2, mitochondrial-like [Sinocyclocheilus anshuiensis]|uniref:Pentatricopeptide repeat-containing protein 2, mitochondrial-like n=1 Tax=Sinocyclocheilus anshuiensis TaxID=1608454 RepID=A0A671LR81_9TELE|nr:PREDICTED: pentatricopeptide repeat-containing protein 2, mitochondrial-like [Sinocyclocheilus anshuiensis]
MALRGLNACARIMLTDSSRAAVLRGAIKSDCLKCRHGAKRYLLSEDVVKLQDFQQRKLAVAHQVSRSKGYYFDTVNQKMEKKMLILKDELKILLYLCQSAEDVFMARNAMYRYHEENRNMAFGEFKFGPLFMRLCYELGLEELGARTLTDPALKGFFSDSTSFNIAIDMLFTKQCYKSCLEVVGEMKKQGVPFSKDTFMLAFATCYKLNTSKSYHICLTLLEEGQTKGSLIPRHAYCFAAALALKQNDIERAQAFYSQIISTDSRLCQNLRVLILAMKGSMKEAVSALTTALVSKTPVFVKKPEFSQEVVNVLKNKSVGGLWEGKVEQVVRRLEEADQITKQTIDDFLCHTPSRRRPLGILEQERKTSRRTRRTLQSTLLLE